MMIVFVHYNLGDCSVDISGPDPDYLWSLGYLKDVLAQRNASGWKETETTIYYLKKISLAGNRQEDNWH